MRREERKREKDKEELEAYPLRWCKGSLKISLLSYTAGETEGAIAGVVNLGAEEDEEEGEDKGVFVFIFRRWSASEPSKILLITCSGLLLYCCKHATM